MRTGARIGFAHDEIDVCDLVWRFPNKTGLMSSSQLEKYEILVGNPNSVRWIPVSGRLKLQALGARPVDGGVDCNGSQLYVARSHFKGGIHPGKVGEHLKCAFIPYKEDEEETHVRDARFAKSPAMPNFALSSRMKSFAMDFNLNPYPDLPHRPSSGTIREANRSPVNLDR
jgi:Protein of unknown function (DUF3421)